MKKLFFSTVLMAVFSLFTLAAVAQGTVKGVVVDSKTGEALIGASVIEAGTTNGTVTNTDGAFSLKLVNAGEIKIEVSFIGYNGFQKTVKVAEGETVDLGKIEIGANEVELADVIVIGKGVIDLEEDRQTPIAVSTITVKEIQTKAVGNVEFPEMMKNTPSVYVSGQSGGFGDSEMFTRGFDQTNTAFLLNGQPINGMEDGKMYWSNWAGLSDVANAVQIQRGLGSSKLAISSVGGTINIVTKATDLQEGGYARIMAGNDEYYKITGSYSSGINEKGWGYSIMLDYWQGRRKWSYGTKGAGQNYFLSVGKIIGDHKINFLLVGSPQWHGQAYAQSKDDYEKYGRKYNANYGYDNGDFLTIRKNYYHKPIFNFNWDWDISKQANLSTVLYASFGRGGGTGTLGTGTGYITGYEPTENGLVDWSAIRDYNSTVSGGVCSGYNGLILRSSVNNHKWYGMVSNFNYDTEKNITFNIGTDIRFYTGDHFRQIVNLLGLNGRETSLMQNTHTVTKTFDADPWAALFNYADEGDRVAYDYSETVNYQGLFGQVEYANDDLSAFIQGSISNQSYQREDRTNFTSAKESDKTNKTGYNIKGGAAYAFASNHKVYANTGFYSRQPFSDNVFSGSYTDYTELADPEVDNEEIFGLEGGYSYKTRVFQLNFNAYYTTWKNRFLSVSTEDGSGNDIYTRFTSIAENHKGLELDAKYKPIPAWMLRGYATIGDWKYSGSSPYRQYDEDWNLIKTGDADLTDTKIGDAPQFTLGLGTSYDIIMNKLSVDLDFNYYDKLYGYVDEEAAATAALDGTEYQPEELDGYALLDLGATYRMTLGENSLVFRGNIYNVLNTEYFSKQYSSSTYVQGQGTTFNFSVRYNF